MKCLVSETVKKGGFDLEQNAKTMESREGGVIGLGSNP